MARRNDHSRDQIREMAILAAEKIVEDEGPQALSTRKIAKAIGYTVGTLYLVFANLDEIILQINIRTLEILYHSTVHGEDPNKDPLDNLFELGIGYFNCAHAHTHRWHLFYSKRILPTDAETLADYRIKYQSLFDLIEGNLIRAAGGQTQGEEQLAARVIWSSVHGISELAMREQHSETYSLEQQYEFIKILISSYVHGWVESIKAKTPH